MELFKLVKEQQQQEENEEQIRQDGILMPPHHLTNFKIHKYFQSKTKFNGAYSRNNLPRIKDEAYAINLDEFKSIETYQIALYVNINLL